MISIDVSSRETSMWEPYDNNQTLGTEGSESGIIERDEIYESTARITLEAGGQVAPYAITCGIFGWMVHTHFVSQQETADQDFDAMKQALSRIVNALEHEGKPRENEEEDAIALMSAFVHQYS